MAELPRLNGIIKALEEGGVAFVGAAPADGAAGTNAPYDGALFEMEHGPYDIRALQEGLQSMLDRRQIAQRGLAPAAIAARMRAQLGEAERAAHADVVVDNSGTLAALRTRLATLWRKRVVGG
jgi:4-hydroxy-2-oxoheptanedioate aldolase